MVRALREQYGSSTASLIISSQIISSLPLSFRKGEEAVAVNINNTERKNDYEH